MDDFVFAEIEIEAPAQHAPGVTGNVPVGIPIVPRVPDPVREKFYAMRVLATKRPFPRSDSELFYRQAQFMEEFTDDYDGDAVLNMYFPCYQQMGYDYLRTYFTWRTRVRSGDMRPVSLSYIFLYIYELLSGIGVDNPGQGLNALMGIWGKFHEHYPAIERYLPGWLKDYHVFYELPHSFADFVSEHNMPGYYSMILLFDVRETGQLDIWNSVSGYDVTKSRFYKDGNEELLSKCFDAVLSQIRDFCGRKGTNPDDMLIYGVSRRQPWRPFKNALFGSSYRQNDREVHISKYERYYCKNGQWTANLPVYYSSQKDFTGYIIKKTEACLRNETGYKYKLAAEMKPGIRGFRELQRMAATRAELDKVIGKAVADFYRDLNRVVVTVDHRSLSRIREQALETQEQLIVEDEVPVQETGGKAAAEDGIDAALPECADAAAGFSDVPSMQEGTPLTLSFSDGWKALGDTLNGTQLEALRLVLSGDGDIKAYADSAGIMLEVLIDGINEMASDCIGDSILELADNVYIFDEYREYVQSVINQ